MDKLYYFLKVKHNLSVSLIFTRHLCKLRPDESGLRVSSCSILCAIDVV